MKQAVLLLSFGTSVEEARQRDIAPVEEALRKCTGLPCRVAYTSPTIRGILAKRGETVPGLEEVLESLAADGVEEVLVQPTHLLYGFEYDSIQKTVRETENLKIMLGKPLLSNTDDLQFIAGVLDRLCPQAPGTAAVFLGHGTEHFANMVYPALQTALRLLGREDILIGTVEGWPGYAEIRQMLAGRDVKRVCLSPLMLVAGDHAQNDMAGDEPDSWKSRLEGEGYAVEPRMAGLGSLAQVQALYTSHFQELLREAGHGA